MPCIQLRWGILQHSYSRQRELNGIYPDKLLWKPCWRARVTDPPGSVHSPLGLDAEPLSPVHVQRACPLAVPVTFRAVLFSIARFAVNFGIMNRYSCAVQVFPADHWRREEKKKKLTCLKGLFPSAHAVSQKSSEKWCSGFPCPQFFLSGCGTARDYRGQVVVWISEFCLALQRALFPPTSPWHLQPGNLLGFDEWGCSETQIVQSAVSLDRCHTARSESLSVKKSPCPALLARVGLGKKPAPRPFPASVLVWGRAGTFCTSVTGGTVLFWHSYTVPQHNASTLLKVTAEGRTISFLNLLLYPNWHALSVCNGIVPLTKNLGRKK